MPNQSNLSLPSDVCLLLRADAERRWLHREVIPVLRQIETCERLDEDALGAALAYLEAMWDEAQLRAGATDAARASLSAEEEQEAELPARAGRYHAAVRALREVVAIRVAPFVGRPAQAGDALGGGSDSPLGVCGSDSRLGVEAALGGGRRVGGCAPRAA
jgi:hypothetical protein